MTSTSAGEGIWTTSGEMRYYRMPQVVDYKMSETCSGSYKWDGYTCTWSAQSSVERLGYHQPFPANAVYELKVSWDIYRVFDYENDDTYMSEEPAWGISASFADPNTSYNVTANDSCGDISVVGHNISWGTEPDIQGTGTSVTDAPPPPSLVNGDTPAGTAKEGYGSNDVASWDFTYHGPAQKPSAPIIGSASSGKIGSPVNATARWDAPTNVGGSAITAYKVQAQKLSASGAVIRRFNATRVPTARELTMVLPKGRYKFRVAAVNAKGTSSWSANSTVVRAR